MKLQKETMNAIKREAPHGKWYGDACGAAFALEIIGERWSLLIVRELMLGPRRFSELRASLPGVSAKVLTERLEGLESAGVLARRKLPSPASVQVYQLTAWGYLAETAILELGRWAARSQFHDPTLPLSPVSLMLSLRTMIDRDAASGVTATIGFEVGGEHFLVRLTDGDLAITRRADGDPEPDFAVRTAVAFPFLRVIYGKEPLLGVMAEGDLTVTGDIPLAERVFALFALPPKCA